MAPANASQRSPSKIMSGISNGVETEPNVSTSHGQGMGLFALGSSPKENGLVKNDGIKDPKVSTVSHGRKNTC